MVEEITDEIRKARYLKMGMEWYNKFLKRNIALQIKNIETVQSSVLSDSPLSDNRMFSSILYSFDESDKFRPLRHI